MPQTSPINWMLVSNWFIFLLINLIMKNFFYSIKKNMFSKKNIFKKNIMWKF